MGAPAPPTPESSMSQAQSQLMLDQAKFEREQQQAAAERERAAQEEAALIAKLAPKHTQAYNAAQSYYDTQLGARGVDRSIADMYGLDDAYFSAIDNARMGIEETDTNPFLSYNTRGNFEDAYSTGLNRYRGDTKKKLYDVAGDGFEYDTFADTADDAIINEILTGQREDAFAQIDAAYKRGQLNDVGYKRALKGLDDQFAAASGQVQNIGQGVLSDYRSKLSGFRDSQLDRIDMMDFTDPYNFDSIASRLSGMTNDFTNRMRGDLTSAIGDTSYFDPSTLIGKGGAVQGYYNPSSTAGTAIDDPLNKKPEDQKTENVLF
jgi:hypothetical protein